MYYGYGYMGWYASAIILLPALLLTIYAQAKVKSNYNKYSQVMNMRRLSGAQAARMMLDANGLYHVKINITNGKLTDHYDPRTQTVTLSTDVYNNASLASIGVACHECGHAVQHATGYSPLKLRSFIVPIANFGSGMAIPLFVLGLIMGIEGLEILGIVFFSFAVFFQAVTLPVEFNASKRALIQMQDLGIVMNGEEQGAKKVLSAAAMTYVAALLMSLLQLVRLILLSRSRR